jgi:hypothetical protein
MYDNIGGKLKTVAAVTAWLGIAGGGLIGLTAGGSMGLGWPMVIIGISVALMSVIGSYPMYAFGQLVEDVRAIKNAGLQGTPAEMAQSTENSAQLPEL